MNTGGFYRRSSVRDRDQILSGSETNHDAVLLSINEKLTAICDVQSEQKGALLQLRHEQQASSKQMQDDIAQLSRKLQDVQEGLAYVESLGSQGRASNSTRVKVPRELSVSINISELFC
jgi:hypothetical protein